ncbi:SdpI family protein [Alicyclobacillus mali (ex Roth et al. 2021)]|uniref:SdpI family protein n=1 Tax=Alicyclobacillus mali (ex Roth et al. 2021) TaxID=1123961 RepID=UPI001E32C07F|nr:SdpI family protein [Alicyclobacillus mali (ex Roth et al. 2021)]
MGKRKPQAVPWWGWAAWAMALAFGCLAYPHLPADIPSYLQSNDTPRSRFWVVFDGPAVMLGIMLLWYAYRWWKRNSKLDASFWSTYRYIGGVVVVCVSLMYAADLAHVLDRATLRWEATASGLMFMLIANVLPRVRPNGWIGVRVSWTFADERVWTWTHRLCGQLGIPAGMLIILLAWLLPAGHGMLEVAMLVPVCLWLFIALVASYMYARRLRKL